jgi:hypothetical protein
VINSAARWQARGAVRRFPGTPDLAVADGGGGLPPCWHVRVMVGRAAGRRSHRATASPRSSSRSWALHPIGVIFGGLILALSYLGGEAAQIDLGMPNAVTGIFQGILLFFLLACDVLILYRLRGAKPVGA